MTERQLVGATPGASEKKKPVAPIQYKDEKHWLNFLSETTPSRHTASEG